MMTVYYVELTNQKTTEKETFGITKKAYDELINQMALTEHGAQTVSNDLCRVIVDEIEKMFHEHDERDWTNIVCTMDIRHIEETPRIESVYIPDNDLPF